jgi:hypothetical protein
VLSNLHSLTELQYRSHNKCGRPLHLTMADSSPKNRLLKAWENDWFCYWDDSGDGAPSYGVPQNPEQDYVFKPALQEETSTSPLVVVSVNVSTEILESERVKSARTLLEGLHSKLTKANITCDCFGSESQHDFSPFLLLGNLESALDSHHITENHALADKHQRTKNDDSVDDVKEEEPSTSEKFLGSFKSSKAAAKWVLEAVGAHPVLVEAITVPKKADKGDDDHHEDALCGAVFGKLTAEMFEKLTVDGRPPLVFYCGSEKLNPVPLFVISRLASNVFGGFISAIIHT